VVARLSALLHITCTVLAVYPQTNCPLPARLAVVAQLAAAAFELAPIVIAAGPAVYSQIDYLSVSQVYLPAAAIFADAAFRLTVALLAAVLAFAVCSRFIRTAVYSSHFGHSLLYA